MYFLKFDSNPFAFIIVTHCKKKEKRIKIAPQKWTHVHLLSHRVWSCAAYKRESGSACSRWQEQILTGKQLVGSGLQSKWEFLSGKNNETVYFHCILNEKSIDPPCVPVALHLQYNNRTTANRMLIWKRKKSNLLAKMLTILSSQIIKAEWSCNCCLRKIISALSSLQKTMNLTCGCLVYTIEIKGTYLDWFYCV